MSIVLNVDCGFVTEAPTRSLTAETDSSVENVSVAMRDICPEGVNRIKELGVHFERNDFSTNIWIALYSDDGAGNPQNKLYEAGPFTTVIGWNVFSGLEWDVSPGTPYHLAFACSTAGGSYEVNIDTFSAQTTHFSDFGAPFLKDPFEIDSSGTIHWGVYALVEFFVNAQPLFHGQDL